MKPYYQDERVQIFHGDCRELSFENISAIVTDPPYGLTSITKRFGKEGSAPAKYGKDGSFARLSGGFMGKLWDGTGVEYDVKTWEHLKRQCLSGSPLLSFGGTRTFHRIACAIEDAGWEIRDTIMWVYGSGFPKSLDISKVIDKQQGTYVRGQVSPNSRNSGESPSGCYGVGVQTKTLPNPQSPEAQLWEGYGTALKPAYEPIILGMNPLDGTFAENALKHKVAGLNIDGCRILCNDKAKFPEGKYAQNTDIVWRNDNRTKDRMPKGRFPANFIHDGSQLVMELFPDTKSGKDVNPTTRPTMNRWLGPNSKYMGVNYGDNGSAARFFYCAKASKAERDKGLEQIPKQRCGMMEDDNYPIKTGSGNLRNTIRHNNHPTVKPLALMEYLVKLIKMPEYNLILDPFMGSGTTLLACSKLGIPCIGIDNDEHTCEIAARRCSQEVMELY